MCSQWAKRPKSVAVMLCLARPTCPTLRLVRAFSSLFREETQFILAGAGEQLRLDGRAYLAGSEDLAQPTVLQPASQVHSHIILYQTRKILKHYRLAGRLPAVPAGRGGDPGRPAAGGGRRGGDHRHQAASPDSRSAAGHRSDWLVVRLGTDYRLAGGEAGHRLAEKGALLFRGLGRLVSSNEEFSKLAAALGTRFSYTAGFASREEQAGAPGVMAASDDPPEVGSRRG